jgi:inner membrane protein
MDSLTHIAVGACIGELVAGKKLGKKAMLLGALGQSIPDIDFVAGYWMSTAADLLAHRGFTHSILFAMLITIALAIVSARLWKKNKLTIQQWLLFWGVQLVMHLFLDIFNVYGTGLFEPFSHYRVSLNTFFVLDPLFSIWPVIGLILLLIMHSEARNRTRISIAALCLSGVYMSYSVANKLIINTQVQQSFSHQHPDVHRFFSTPTPLNNVLWYVVGEADSGFYVGYRSLFDKGDTISYRYVPKNSQLITDYVYGYSTNGGEIDRLKRFSQGYWTMNMWHDTLVFNDLRFGEQTAGLASDRLCFYYYLHPGVTNEVIIQRGRFAGWSDGIIDKFIDRIQGQ